MRVKFKGSLVTIKAYHMLVLFRMLSIIHSRFVTKLNSVPLNLRNTHTFADIAYERYSAALDVCFKAARKYPDLQPDIMRIIYSYVDDIQHDFGGLALNDATYNLKNS